MYSSGKYRVQPIWFSISTPQYNRYSLAWQEWTKASQIINGNSDNVEYLAVIHGVPHDCDWHNPEEWWKHLAGLGDCLDQAYYLNDYANSKDNPRELCRFRNHLLCQWTESIDQWLPIEKIEQSQHEFTECTLVGQRCFIGCDGAVNGLAAYAIYFPDTGQVIMRFFHPQVTADRSDAKLGTKLNAWAQDNHVNLTQGDMFDWESFRESLIDDCKKFNVIEVAYDPFSLEGRSAELSTVLPCLVVPISPTPNHLAAPTKHLERLILGNGIKIKANPCMTWNLANAAVRIVHDSPIIDRDKSTGRYDGVSALVLALNRHLVHLGNSGDCDVILL